MAIRTISNIGGNFGSIATWVEGVVPTASDDIVATATSGPLTVNALYFCNSFNLTNYANTVTLANTLAVNGSITFSPTTTLTGAPYYISVKGTSTITTNGVAIPNLAFHGAATVTLVGNATVTGILSFPNAIITITINNNNLYIYGGVSQQNGCVSQGTTTFVLAGTTSWNSINTDSLVYNPVVINSPSTVTIITRINIGKSLIWVSGTIVTTGATLYINNFGTPVTINIPSSVTWNSINMINGTITLLNDLYTNALGVGTGGNPIINGFNIYNSGNFSAVNNYTCSGTTVIHLIGTGTWITNSCCFNLKNNVIINTSGTITMSGDINYSTGTLTYISGTVIPPTTFTTYNTCTLNTAGISWNNVNLLGNTITLNSTLTVNNILYLGTFPSTTLTGSAGFNTNTLNIVAAGSTINFKPGTTYNVSGYFSSVGTLANKIKFLASSAYAYFNLLPTATQNVKYTSATNIDSSGGKRVNSLKGTLINTINWFAGRTNFFLQF